MNGMVLAKDITRFAFLKWSAERLAAFSKKAFQILNGKDDDKIVELGKILIEMLEVLKKKGLSREETLDELEPIMQRFEAL